MTKKILPFLLLVAMCFVAFFSCKKNGPGKTDATLNYFPLKFGKYVTYAVDSIYYIDTNCVQYESKSQQKYSITDTFTDKKHRLSYIMDVYSRPYDGADWHAINTILITPTPAGLLYFQDNSQYVKLVFPVVNGFSWMGNQYVETQDSMFAYLKNWNYTYHNSDMAYNDGLVNFNKTVTVIETDQTSNSPFVDSNVSAYRIYAKEVYAYNVGMIYKEWTHWTYSKDTSKCVKGYSVVMKAIDYN